jgi:hypothetical protein
MLLMFGNNILDGWHSLLVMCVNASISSCLSGELVSMGANGVLSQCSWLEPGEYMLEKQVLRVFDL